MLWQKDISWPSAWLLLPLPALLSWLWPLPWSLLLSLSMLALHLHNLLRARAVYEYSSETFQRALLAAQYREVKDIYLRMRGWRHDYHNHLQTMQAALAAGQLEKIGSYLKELEGDLQAIELRVNSGNPLLDAILNCKLALAEQAEIAVQSKVAAMKDLSVQDTDLCVMLGNLLDNAIEAAQELPAEERFIRLYLDVYGEQLYFSLQNSAKEILSFEERHYISTKRGNHGLGLQRVQLLAEKYEGYLNLQNELGIFAVELTVPLRQQPTAAAERA